MKKGTKIVLGAILGGLGGVAITWFVIFPFLIIGAGHEYFFSVFEDLGLFLLCASPIVILAALGGLIGYVWARSAKTGHLSRQRASG